MSFFPDIFTTGFAGLLFYPCSRVFEDGMVAEVIAENSKHNVGIDISYRRSLPSAFVFQEHHSAGKTP